MRHAIWSTSQNRTFCQRFIAHPVNLAMIRKAAQVTQAEIARKPRVVSGQRTAKIPEMVAIAWATGVTVAGLAGTGTGTVADYLLPRKGQFGGSASTRSVPVSRLRIRLGPDPEQVTRSASRSAATLQSSASTRRTRRNPGRSAWPTAGQARRWLSWDAGLPAVLALISAERAVAFRPRQPGPSLTAALLSGSLQDATMSPSGSWPRS